MKRTICSSYNISLLSAVTSLLHLRMRKKVMMMVLMLPLSRCLNGNSRRKSRLWKQSWLLKVPVTLLNRRVLNANEVRKPKKRRQPKLRNLSKMTR